MIQEKDYKRLDIKAEVLLAEILERYEVIDFDDVSLQPNGGFNHGVSRDISKVKASESDFGHKKTIIEVRRPGLFDALPAGIFHDLNDRVVSDDNRENSVLERVKKQKIEEKNARKFFSPFDQTINRYRVLLEQEERQILTGFPLEANHTLFDTIWGDFGGVMSNYQKSVLFTLLPMTNHIIGDMHATALSYEAVLALPVNIRKETFQRKFHDESLHLGLGDCIISEDFVLGDSSDEREDIYIIKIGPMTVSECTNYLPDADGSAMLSLLSDYLLPIEITVRYEYLVNTEPLQLDESPTLDLASGDYRLGYSIHL